MTAPHPTSPESTSPSTAPSAHTTSGPSLAHTAPTAPAEPGHRGTAPRGPAGAGGAAEAAHVADVADVADADVLVVGAGPAGLALACALADAGLRPLLVEQQDAAALAAPAEDGRDIALTHRARRILQQLGLWAALPPAQIAPLRQARVLDGSGAGPLSFGRSAPTPAPTPALTPARAPAQASDRTRGSTADGTTDNTTDRHAARNAAGTGDAEPLGWLVPNHLIRRAAHDAARGRGAAIAWCTGAQVTALRVDGPRAELALADGRRLRAPLVVAADSRFSSLRRMAGIGAAMTDFGRSVVVGRVALAQDHGATAWECFGYQHTTLALLPMNGGQCSAVVTVPSDQAAGWLALDDAGFAQRVQALGASMGHRLDGLQAAGPRHHYPLVGVYAQRFAAPRVALVGDAAVGMHPVTAHGYNFGLYGVEVLARALQAAARQGLDLGALPALQAYEAEHRRVTRPIYLGTNAVVGLFTREDPLARLARRAVLGVSEHAPGLSQLVKAAVGAQLTGQAPGWAGGLPLPGWLQRLRPPPLAPWAR